MPPLPSHSIPFPTFPPLITTDSQGSAVLKDSWVPFLPEPLLGPLLCSDGAPVNAPAQGGSSPFWKHLLVTLRSAVYEIPACFLTLFPAPSFLHSMGAIPNLPASGQPLRCLTSPGFLGPLWSRTKVMALLRIPLLPIFMSFTLRHLKRLASGSSYLPLPVGRSHQPPPGGIIPGSLSKEPCPPAALPMLRCPAVLQWGCPVPFLKEGLRRRS